MNSIAHMEGIKIGGMNINNVRYADDTAIISESEDQLQNIMDVVTTESKKSRSGNQSEEIFHPSNLQEKRNSKILHKGGWSNHKTSGQLRLSW